MRRLSYQYYMQLSFLHPVERHHFTLRCLPMADVGQKIEEQTLQITPSYVGGYETDSFGNQFVYGIVRDAHTHFVVDVKGVACVDHSIPIPVTELHRIGMFRYPSKLTKTGAALKSLLQKCGTCVEMQGAEDGCNALERACMLMDVLYHNFQYEPGVTGVNTTAEEACELGRGVCQDYAHILLALCRMEWIPCRYVVGMMMGEGASHAWVEVCDGKEWIALDPTHNRLVDDNYIRISYGRDAQDCTINQGYFYGSAEQTQEIRVVVEEMSYDR